MTLTSEEVERSLHASLEALEGLRARLTEPTPKRTQPAAAAAAGAEQDGHLGAISSQSRGDLGLMELLEQRLPAELQGAVATTSSKPTPSIGLLHGAVTSSGPPCSSMLLSAETVLEAEHASEGAEERLVQELRDFLSRNMARTIDVFRT